MSRQIRFAESNRGRGWGWDGRYLYRAVRSGLTSKAATPSEAVSETEKANAK